MTRLNMKYRESLFQDIINNHNEYAVLHEVLNELNKILHNLPTFYNDKFNYYLDKLKTDFECSGILLQYLFPYRCLTIMRVNYETITKMILQDKTDKQLYNMKIEDVKKLFPKIKGSIYEYVFNKILKGKTKKLFQHSIQNINYFSHSNMDFTFQNDITHQDHTLTIEDYAYSKTYPMPYYNFITQILILKLILVLVTSKYLQIDSKEEINNINIKIKEFLNKNEGLFKTFNI